MRQDCTSTASAGLTGWRRLLLLTGSRRDEADAARWREFVLERKAWVVPPERFKSNASHLVPLPMMPLPCSRPCSASARAITSSRPDLARWRCPASPRLSLGSTAGGVTAFEGAGGRGSHHSQTRGAVAAMPAGNRRRSGTSTTGLLAIAASGLDSLIRWMPSTACPCSGSSCTCTTFRLLWSGWNRRRHRGMFARLR